MSGHSIRSNMNRIRIGLTKEIPFYGTFLVVFSSLYIVLPRFFAIDLSDSLPILSADRVLIILLCLLAVTRKNGKKRIDNSFAIYIVLMFVVLVYQSITGNRESIKVLFSLFVEELFFYYALSLMIRDENDILNMMNSLVITSGVMSIFAVIEVLFSFNVFSLLYTTSRENLMSAGGYIRLGLNRAEAGFGQPVYFAVYFICIIPFCMYLYEKTHKLRYFIILVLEVLGVFCTGTRGAIVVLLFLGCYVIAVSKKRVLRGYLRWFFFAIPLFLVMIAMVPKLYSYIIGLIRSVLAIAGLASNSNNFGENAAGSLSRLQQLTGIVWNVRNGRVLMGAGANGHTTGEIKYFLTQHNRWVATGTIDIGYLGYFLQYGLIGLFAYLTLYIGSFRKLLNYLKYKDDAIIKAFKCFCVLYSLLLFTSTGLQKLFIMLFAMMCAYMNIDSKKCASDPQSIGIAID